MRIVNFVDGASSETTPTIGNITTSDYVKYANDAAYEAAEVGSPVDGNVYYNTTTDKVRSYIDGAWTNEADEVFVQAGLDLKQDLSEKDQANGYAGLDGGGKLSVSTLPTSVMEFQGVWNANTNTPTLIDGTGDSGDTFRTSVAGTQDLGSGSQDFEVGDWVTYSGAIWERSDFSGAATVISDLTDVDTTGVADGEVLTFDSGSGEWQPAAAGGGGGISQENIALIGKGNASWTYQKASVASVLLQENLDVSSTHVMVPDSQWGFNFIPKFTGDAKFMVVKWHDLGATTGDIVLKLYNTDGSGFPTGAVLTQASIGLAAVGPGLNTSNFVFGASVQLVAGTRYAAMWENDQGDANIDIVTSSTNDTDDINIEEPAFPFDSYVVSSDQNTPYHELFLENTVATGKLTLSQSSFVSVPDLADDRHEIEAQDIYLGKDQAAYITLDRSAGSPTVRTVVVDDITNIAPDGDKLIIYRSSETTTPPLITAEQLDVNSQAAILVTTANGAHRSQEFIATKSGLLSKIRLKQGESIPNNITGTYSIDIRTDDGGGKPTLVILDSITLNVDDLPDLTTMPLVSFQEYTFNNTANIVEGVSYHIVWSNVTLTGAPGGIIDIEYTTSATYAGSFRTSTDDGVNWGADIPAVDVQFEVEVQTTDGDAYIGLHDPEKISNGDTISLQKGEILNKIQTKFLEDDVISSGTIASLTFNALVIGKQYTIRMQTDLNVEVGANDIQVGLDIVHNGATIGRSELVINTSSTSGGNVTSGLVVNFTASATTLTFSAFSASINSFINGNGSAAETWVQIEERNDLIVTTDFT